MLFLRQGSLLGLGERRGFVGSSGLAVELSVVFLDVFLAEGVDDFGCWVDTLSDEAALDGFGVGFELSESGEGCSPERFHGEVWCWE